jgi:hypothetical protein
MYLTKAERTRIAEILDIMVEELDSLFTSVLSEVATSPEDEIKRRRGFNRATNEWVFELSRFLMVPIKQLGDEEEHLKEGEFGQDVRSR